MAVRKISKRFSVQSVVGDQTKHGRPSFAWESGEAYAGIPTEVVPEDIGLEDDEDELDLFEDQNKSIQPMSNWFSKLASYRGGIEPTVDETKEMRKTKVQPVRRLGTLLGVFLPCCQNIIGILLFVRVGWITGVAGTLQSTVIVVMCCCCTLLTALSMSAIATNGKVPAGGSYFMISRSIGPEFGGAVGILFYLGTTIASAMYLVGAVEIFLKYMAPQASLFGDVTSNEVLFNNTRIYGTVLLLFVMCCVLLGIKFVSRFAALSLVAVFFSICCVYIGFFTASPSNSPYVCSLGGRLLSRDFITVNGTVECTKTSTGPIYQVYCADPETATKESCDFFKTHDLRYYPAIPGLSSGNFLKNFLPSFYREEGQAYDNLSFPPKREYGQGPNAADITSSFMILLAIYFPSVTGIMAGSNRSGDLANPQIAIPRGTTLAILFTSSIYISAPLLISAICDGAVMRDKFGESYGGGLLVAAFAWPSHWVILVGSCLSTIGAGLQCLTGAPRLLQAIAQDNVMPFLNPFKKTTKRGEPFLAQILSYFLSQIGMLIASIDALTPLITMLFLMCYGFVNLATLLNGFLEEPNWRPRFRFHHWFLSLIGLLLCTALMFISSWYYAIVAFVLAGGIYKYIEYRGASKEWGDATRGLQMSTAKRAILKLGDNPVHTKNWRPQLLVYIPLDEQLQVRHERLGSLVHQLKAGHGLTLIVSILEGDVYDRREDVLKAKATLNDLIRQHHIKGLSQVLVCSDVGEGMKNMAQCAGLGSLRHNTLMVSFPEDWRSDTVSSGKKLAQFISIVRASHACDIAMLVPKGIDSFPANKSAQVTGSVDVWCVVHDGGLLLLTSYLLMRNRVWRQCELRMFVVASDTDDTVNLKKGMDKFLYDLRINATVEVVAMSTADISAYVAQRTAGIEQRRQLFSQMKLSNNAARRDPQQILDQHRKSTATEAPNIEVITLNAFGEKKDSSKEKSCGNAASPSKTTGSGVTFAMGPGPAAEAREEQGLSPIRDEQNNRSVNEFTFSPSAMHPLNMHKSANQTDDKNADEGQDATTKSATQPTKKSGVQRRLHSATRLNELLQKHSSEAALVILNMPQPSKSIGSSYYYMDYIEVLTEGLPRVLLVRGTGREVITTFSE